MAALLDLENDSGESLHICSHREELWIGTFGGGEGAAFTLDPISAADTAAALVRWLRTKVCADVHASGEVCIRPTGHGGHHHAGTDGLGWESP